MDYVVLQKHIDSYIESIPKVELAADGSNASDFVVADVIGGRDFTQNYGGYPRSEIAEINAAATLEIQQNLLRKLQDYSPTDNPTAGLTDAQIKLAHKSKYLQAPCEVVDYVNSQIAIRDEMRAAVARAAAAEKTPKMRAAVARAAAAEKTPKKVDVKQNEDVNE